MLRILRRLFPIFDRFADELRSLEVSVNGATWRRVNNLSNCGPNDPIFTFDADAKTIAFGDGTHGQRPPNGSHIRVSYRTGSGDSAVVVDERFRFFNGKLLK